MRLGFKRGSLPSVEATHEVDSQGFRDGGTTCVLPVGLASPTELRYSPVVGGEARDSLADFRAPCCTFTVTKQRWRVARSLSSTEYPVQWDCKTVYASLVE